MAVINSSPTRIGRLYAIQASDYATTDTATAIAAGLLIEGEVFMPPTTREIFERAAIRGGFYTINPVSGSQSGATFSVKFPAHGLSSTAGPTTQPINHPESLLLYSILGGLKWGNYTGGDAVDAGGSSADEIDLNSLAAGFFVGNGIITENDTGAQEMAFVKSMTGTTLNLKQALTFTPEDATPVYGTNTAYLSTANPISFSFLWQGYQANTQIRMGGVVPTSVNISLGPKAMVEFEVSFSVNQIIADNTGASALGAQAYGLPVLPVPTGNNSARLVFGGATEGSASTDMDVDGMSITIEQELVPQLAHGASEGVRDMLVSNRTITASFSSLLGAVNQWDTTATGQPLTDISNGDTRTIQLQIGSADGNMMGILIPVPVMTEPPTLTDMNGVIGASFTVQPGSYIGDGVSTDAGDSDFRVAFG